MTSYDTGPYLVTSRFAAWDRYNPSDPMHPIHLPPGAVEFSLICNDVHGKRGFILNAVRIEHGRLLSSAQDELTIVPPPPDAKPYQLPMQLTTEGANNAS